MVIQQPSPIDQQSWPRGLQSSQLSARPQQRGSYWSQESAIQPMAYEPQVSVQQPIAYQPQPKTQQSCPGGCNIPSYQDNYNNQNKGTVNRKQRIFSYSSFLRKHCQWLIGLFSKTTSDDGHTRPNSYSARKG
jgi:hypothetical protein